MKVLGALAAAICTSASWGQVLDIRGKPSDPFQARARAYVLLFVRTDCPITNRYAPELQRLVQKFTGDDVRWWLVYPDRTETAAKIGEHIRSYNFPGAVLIDPRHELVRRAHASIAPEAALFDGGARLVYHGRIDDRWVEIGKARPAAETHDLEDAIAALLAGKPIRRAETAAVGCSLADLR